MRSRHLACLAVAMLVLLGACDDGAESPDDEAGRPTREAGGQKNKGDERVVREGESVGSGTHVVATFRPQFTFRYSGDRSWRVARQTERLLLLHADGANQIVFARPDQVYTFAGATASLSSVPLDLRSWLEANPHLNVTEQPSAAVGRRTGPTIDVTATSELENVGGCPIPCVPLVPLEIADKSFFLVKGLKARFVFLTTGEGQMFVAITASPRDFKGFLRQADRFLKTVRF